MSSGVSGCEHKSLVYYNLISEYVAYSSLNPWKHAVVRVFCQGCQQWLIVDRCVGRLTGLNWSEDIVEKKSCPHPSFTFKGAWQTAQQTPALFTGQGLALSLKKNAWICCKRCDQELIMSYSIHGKFTVVCNSCGGDTDGIGKKSYKCAHSYCVYCVSKKQHQHLTEEDDCDECQQAGGRPDYQHLSDQAKSCVGVMAPLIQALNASSQELKRKVIH